MRVKIVYSTILDRVEEKTYQLKFNNKVIVMIKEINNEYKFVDVPEECLNHLRNIISKL